MSFIAKNPLSLPEIDYTPSTPLKGTRGLYPKEDGWYDIDDNGNEKKILDSDDKNDIDRVGQKTENNGEIFNDYDNNIASANNSHAEGANTKAGGYGYKIIATENGCNGVGIYTLSSVTGLEVGMRYSVRLATAKYDVGAITAIDSTNNKITVDNYPGIALETDDDKPSEYSIENYLTIVGRPDLGDTEIGFNAHAEGESTIAQDRDTHAEGRNTKAIGQYGHAEGRNTKAGYSAHAEGRNNIAIGDMSHAEGNDTQALGSTSHAEGKTTTASGIHSHSEGRNTTASGDIAHAEGKSTTASGTYSHAEGNNTTASGYISHAEGNGSQATGGHSHAEGLDTIASEYAAHSEGWRTKAAGSCSHAEGNDTMASGYCAHAEGLNTIASSNWQHVQGKFNVEDTGEKYAHIVGNGHNDTERSNAHTIDWDGNAWFAGDVTIGKDKDVLAKQESLERLQYYGDSDILITPEDYYFCDITEDGAVSIYEGIHGTSEYPNMDLTQLVVPYKIGSTYVSSIDDNAFSYCGALTTITLPNSIIHIGNKAFFNCSKLTSIDIPNTTSIGTLAFAHCVNLTSVTIPDSVTSIGARAFMNCPNLTIICSQGSYADTYAKENRIKVKYDVIDADSLNNNSGGTGAVSSVNRKVGDVVLKAEDVGAYSKEEIGDMSHSLFFDGLTSAVLSNYFNIQSLGYDVYNTKADKASILITSDTSLILTHNQEARLGEIATLTLSMPETIDDLYWSSFCFASGETATSISYSGEPIIWCGDDCDAEGSFIPEANTKYEVHIKKLGSDIVARVGAYA